MDYQGKTAPHHAEIGQHAEAVAPEQNTPPKPHNRPKEYSRKKLILGLDQSLAVFLIVFSFVASGLSVRSEQLAFEVSENPYGALLIFAALFGLLQGGLTFPLRWYSGFVLEHRYGLSNQSIGRWLWESFKGLLVSTALGVPVLLLFFYILRAYGSDWWIPLGIALFFFSVLLSRIAPVVIFPLFYKFEPMPDGGLRERIITLARRAGMSVDGIFVFNLSKNTKKANAAFTGIGKSKRIILGDTLVTNFTDEEIEAVFAHELGHFKLRHIWILMIAGMVTVFAGLALAAWLYELSLGWFGFESIDRIAALPLLAIWLGIYSMLTGPLNNTLSRTLERSADVYAVRHTGKGEPFASALKKLATINLADPDPHPVVEFLFHSHPAIRRRIERIAHLTPETGS